MLLPTPICLEPDVQYSIDVYFSQPSEGQPLTHSHILVDSVSTTGLCGGLLPSQLSSMVILLLDSLVKCVLRSINIFVQIYFMNKCFCFIYRNKCVSYNTKLKCIVLFTITHSWFTEITYFLWKPPNNNCKSYRIVCASNSLKCFTYFIIQCSQQLYEGGTIIIPTLQITELRPRVTDLVSKESGTGVRPPDSRSQLGATAVFWHYRRLGEKLHLTVIIL